MAVSTVNTRQIIMRLSGEQISLHFPWEISEHALNDWISHANDITQLVTCHWTEHAQKHMLSRYQETAMAKQTRRPHPIGSKLRHSRNTATPSTPLTLRSVQSWWFFELTLYRQLCSYPSSVNSELHSTHYCLSAVFHALWVSVTQCQHRLPQDP